MSLPTCLLVLQVHFLGTFKSPRVGPCPVICGQAVGRSLLPWFSVQSQLPVGYNTENQPGARDRPSSPQCLQPHNNPRPSGLSHLSQRETEETLAKHTAHDPHRIQQSRHNRETWVNTVTVLKLTEAARAAATWRRVWVHFLLKGNNGWLCFETPSPEGWMFTSRLSQHRHHLCFTGGLSVGWVKFPILQGEV